MTTIYDWDNFKETWYTEAVKAGKPIWLRIFTWNYPNHPYIVASADRPIYDVQNRFLGMVAADIHLSPKNMVVNWNVFLLLVKEVS
ncbi:PDC sensor domain-containing protein [Nostoc sp.]|uniref:PDC sensor domain-containing protein n=1 Tax=unclassified Nostoc TaxID=2593658 RepID=UPI003FA57A30